MSTFQVYYMVEVAKMIIIMTNTNGTLDMMKYLKSNKKLHKRYKPAIITGLLISA